jgi:hypothetical protein
MRVIGTLRCVLENRARGRRGISPISMKKFEVNGADAASVFSMITADDSQGASTASGETLHTWGGVEGRSRGRTTLMYPKSGV